MITGFVVSSYHFQMGRKENVWCWSFVLVVHWTKGRYNLSHEVPE
jgi:hypothetical protein